MTSVFKEIEILQRSILIKDELINLCGKESQNTIWTFYNNKLQFGTINESIGSNKKRTTQNYLTHCNNNSM